MLGGVVRRPTRQPDETAQRRAVDDRAAPLLAHVAELVLHAGPHTAQVDRVHAIEYLGGFIGHVAWQSLHAGIVERRI